MQKLREPMYKQNQKKKSHSSHISSTYRKTRDCWFESFSLQMKYKKCREHQQAAFRARIERIVFFVRRRGQKNCWNKNQALNNDESIIYRGKKRPSVFLVCVCVEKRKTSNKMNLVKNIRFVHFKKKLIKALALAHHHAFFSPILSHNTFNTDVEQTKTNAETKN